MIIKISDLGLEYLNKKHRKTITLEIITSGGGCCPTFESYEICFKTPKNLNDFNEFEVNDLKIYIDKKAKVVAPVLQFDIEKNLTFSKLIVKGLSLKNTRI